MHFGWWLLSRFIDGTLFIFLWLARLLPLDLLAIVFTPPLKLLMLLIIPKRRVLKNLSAAFGHTYSAATKKGLAKGVQEHFTKNLRDCFLQMANPQHTRQNVEFVGSENLQAALAKGKGVIALGAHIGNFVLVGTRVGAEGYPISTLFRLPRYKRIQNTIQRYLPLFHQCIIPSQPRRAAVRLVLEALKRNEIVFILGDNLKRGTVQTLLFGQTVLSPRGPVSLALRSGAALVPMYLIRNYQGSLELVIEPELTLSRNNAVDLYDDIDRNTRDIVRYLESLIGRYPDQWNWLTVRLKMIQAAAPAIARIRQEPNFQTRKVYHEAVKDADQRIGS